MQTTIIQDIPLNDITLDRLGREPIVDLIVGSINQVASSNHPCMVYGIDGCCTIIHRILIHENLGEAHRKHAYQLMANELGMSHVVVSLIYMALQLMISLGFIYLCPNTMLAHWIYLIVAAGVLVVAYVAFMKKYYHLHEEYLESLKK